MEGNPAPGETLAEVQGRAQHLLIAMVNPRVPELGGKLLSWTI